MFGVSIHTRPGLTQDIIYQVERDYRQRKVKCKNINCNNFLHEEGANCVYECMSKVCFDEIYANEPVSDIYICLSRKTQHILHHDLTHTFGLEPVRGW